MGGQHTPDPEKLAGGKNVSPQPELTRSSEHRGDALGSKVAHTLEDGCEKVTKGRTPRSSDPGPPRPLHPTCRHSVPAPRDRAGDLGQEGHLAAEDIGCQAGKKAHRSFQKHSEHSIPTRKGDSQEDAPARQTSRPQHAAQPPPRKPREAAGVSHPLNLPPLKTCQGGGDRRELVCWISQGPPPRRSPIAPVHNHCPDFSHSQADRQSRGAPSPLSSHPQIHELTNLIHPPIPGRAVPL